MERNIIKILLVLINLNCLYSQNLGSDGNTQMVKNYLDNLRNNTLNYSSLSEKNDKIIGSPYNNENFQKAKVGNEDLRYEIRYNIYTDQLEFSKDGKIYDLIAPDNIVFHLLESNEKLQKLTYVFENANVNGYLYLLEPGSKYTLYKKEKILLKYDEGATNSYVDHSKVRFNHQRPEYLLYFNNKYITLPKNKKDLLKLFENIGLKNYLSQSKNNLKKDEDFVQLVKYLNEKN